MNDICSLSPSQALAVACKELNPEYMPKLANTEPVCDIGPFPSWSDPSKIATMDPWGHIVTEVSLLPSVLSTSTPCRVASLLDDLLSS